MDTFETITSEKRLAYEYVAGSHLYGLNNEDSDVDTKGIFIGRNEDILGLGFGYRDQVSDPRNDNTWYEVGKYCRMLTTSNPTALEGLFAPQDKVITPPSDIIMPLFENKDMLITKQCFKPFVAYAKEQISKARGLNKKIVNPITERKTPFEFAYTFHKQGSTKVSNWLENRGLNKDFCGLVNLPNMHDTYGVYYDWGAHFAHYKITLDIFMYSDKGSIGRWFFNLSNSKVPFETLEIASKNLRYVMFELGILGKKQLETWYKTNSVVKHYRGMCLDSSTEMRSSSVSKGESPICNMVYNESGYRSHCTKYKEYKDWEKNRNEKRYKSNLEKNYDSKNMMHCVRLIHMGKEIAEGRGLILERKEDKEFLMNIRNHKYEYDELIEMVEKDNEALDKAISESTIREKVDLELMNEILFEIRKKMLK